MINQIVVIAGGLATRLYPITQKIPKSMVQVAGQPFFSYQIELFKNAGIKNIVMCVGHLSEQIIDFYGDGTKFGVNIVYSQEKEKLDTGGALKHAQKYLDDRFLTIYGDSYLTYPYDKVIDFYDNHKKAGLMTVWKNEGKIAPSQIVIENELVTKFQKSPALPEAKYIEYGLNILPKDLINQVDKTTFPISDYFDILIPKKQLLALEVPDRFYEIGGFEGLKSTEEIIEHAKK